MILRLLNEEEIEAIKELGEWEDGELSARDFEEFWMHEDTLERIAKAQHQLDLKDFIEWGDIYCGKQNRPQRECGHCWQEVIESLKQLVEE